MPPPESRPQYFFILIPISFSVIYPPHPPPPSPNAPNPPSPSLRNQSQQLLSQKHQKQVLFLTSNELNSDPSRHHEPQPSSVLKPPQEAERFPSAHAVVYAGSPTRKPLRSGWRPPKGKAENRRQTWQNLLQVATKVVTAIDN